MNASFWNKVISFGTTDEAQFLRANRKIIATNLATIVCALIIVPYIILYYYAGFQSLAFFLSVTLVLLLNTIALNYFGLPLAAKLWLILVTNFVCYQFAIACGKDAGMHYFFLPLSIAPFLLFDLEYKSGILLITAISVYLFFVVEYQVFSTTIFFMDSKIMSQLYYPNIIGTLVALLLIMFYLSHENESSEKALILMKEKFEEEIKEARKVIHQSNYNNDNSIAEVLLQQINELRFSKEFLKSTHDRLKKTNIDLDNFIYTVSHDLKYPISNIEGLLNVLMSDSAYEDEDYKMVVSLISKSVARFKNTIGELTEITKIQSNPDEMTNIQLGDLLEEVLFSLKDQLSDSDATINYNFDLCPDIYFSKKNLRSILFNLVSNALKYRSLDRYPEISIYTNRKDKEYVELSVKDNGLGIHESQKEKVFSMFKRVHDHVDGSGVGLYIVKRVIDNYGGRIELDSEVSKGSNFRIIIKSPSFQSVCVNN